MDRGYGLVAGLLSAGEVDRPLGTGAEGLEWAWSGARQSPRPA